MPPPRLWCDAGFKPGHRLHRRALGNGELGGHEIDAGDRLGDGVFHLDVRIDLHEAHRAVVDEEPHRSRAFVVRA